VELAQALADLVGGRRGLLAPSTLHLFLDVFGDAWEPDMAIHWDTGMYPITRWGIERAVARGVTAQGFAHHDARALRRQLEGRGSRGRVPVVVADGFCPGCGRPAPVAEYLACVRERGGRLVLDDTQALGLLGEPDVASPYGRGGGGTLRRAGVAGDDILVGSSLAKGLGVPIAVLSGGEAVLQRIAERGETRTHCSPPSAAAIRAAARALAINRAEGDELRARLAQRVGYFRRRLREVGLSAANGRFPLQWIEPVPGVAAAALHDRLARRGVRALLLRPQCAGPDDAALAFSITARHHASEIDQAVEALRAAAFGKATARHAAKKEESP
jgi:8-amino-7-oxononanoate synthase